MKSVNIDYKNNIFELPELTRIHGEPTTATLIDLRNEIRCNAQSVTTTLGGGQYGHLGLVMSNNLYLSLPNTEEYERPEYPGPFRFNARNPTEVQIAQEKSDWEEEVRLWREVEAVEQALVQQIVVAVEPKFLKALRNSFTKKLTRDINCNVCVFIFTVRLFLFFFRCQNYGKDITFFDLSSDFPLLFF